MSKSFFRILYRGFSEVTTNEKPREHIKNILELWVKCLIFTTGASIHCAYALTTEEKEKSIIIKKYKMVRNGFTEFMLVDNKGRHFNVNNSLWYWKWNSIEDWTNIKEGDELYFRYYGWRIPSLGLFPNIYMSNKENFLESMTKNQFKEFEAKYDK
jgi:hypothetical protein